MEGQGSSNQQDKYIKGASTSGIVIQEGRGKSNNTTAANQYIPLSSIIRIMRLALPPYAKIADDAKETIQLCVSEFISFITSEANEKCHRECRKTITSEDVLTAMRTLGFDNYVEALTNFQNKCRAQDPVRNSMDHLRFARHNHVAQEPSIAPLARPSLPLPPIAAPSLSMGYTTVLPHATIEADESEYIGLPEIINKYFLDNRAVGEGSSNSTEFDPFTKLP